MDALARRVRVLSLDQIARTWWPNVHHPFQTARSRMRLLEQQRLIRLFSMMVHPEITLSEPLCRWWPDEPLPNLAAVAYQAQRRWTQPPVLLPMAAATQTAVRTFGGLGTRLPKLNERTHDLHLAAVYLWKRRTSTDQAEHWHPEEAVRATYEGYNDKLPDALITKPRPLAIDFIGTYKESRLQDLHRYCERRRIGYEFW